MGKMPKSSTLLRSDTTTTFHPSTRPRPPKEPENYDDILLRIPFKTIAYVTTSLPLLSLVYCFTTCVIFKADEVRETRCGFDNFIPSISAVTGVTPQSYIWRICISLHSTPRFAVTFMYYNFYKRQLPFIAEGHHKLYLTLIRLNFWLNLIELSCFIGTTYISNKDNYPIHEKMFIVFMVCSLCYMLLNTILFRWSRPGELSGKEEQSFWWKKILFVLAMSSTAGLLVFFYQHRVLCLPTAFSGFSLCEYGIAVANMGYHFTALFDFSGLSVIAGYREQEQVFTNGHAVHENDKKND